MDSRVQELANVLSLQFEVPDSGPIKTERQLQNVQVTLICTSTLHQYNIIQY